MQFYNNGAGICPAKASRRLPGHICECFHAPENVHIFIPGVSILSRRKFCVQEVLLHMCLLSFHLNALFGLMHCSPTGEGFLLRSTSGLTGMTAAVLKACYFDNRVFNKKSYLFRDGHRFSEILYYSFCTWLSFCAHLIIPLHYNFLHYSIF